MRKIVLAIFSALVFLAFLSPAFAAVKLNPGTTTFAYQPIFTFNVTDVSGPNPLGIDVAVDKLKIFWNAYFCNKFAKGTCAETIDRSIGVRCYFDCTLQKGELIDAKCDGKTKCEFSGTGAGSCTISSPAYLSKTQNGNNPVNNATCKFYDPKNLNLEFMPYPNRSFYAVLFDTKVSGATTTVGEELSMPVQSTNLGMFADSYSVMIKANKPDLVAIETPDVDTEKINYGGTILTNEKLRMLYAGSVTLEVMSKSNTASAANFDTACTADSDCAYLAKGACRCPDLEGSCASKVCWTKNEVSINAKDASMPEFGLPGFLQIIILAAAALVLKRKL